LIIRCASDALLFLGALVVLPGLQGCVSADCSDTPRCEGSVLIYCQTGSDLLPHDYEEKQDCAAEGMECVQTASHIACALRDPTCHTGSYCKGDTAIFCSDALPGYSETQRRCAPYACVQAEGDSPTCVDETKECFHQPDGQYCRGYSTVAYECFQRALVRSTQMCSYCYINADGLAASEDTKVPCF
jgi:hypothetical protein